MIIAARFNGPPGSGNGGYTAGLVAAHLTGPVEVTLRRPPPLDTPLTVTAGQDATGGTVQVHDGEALVASARTDPGEPPEAVPAVPFADAVAASRGYRGFTAHPFPTCFVCGPDRGDGLGLFPGPLPDGRTATPWQVPPDVSPVLVWAALDCPGGWSVLTEDRPYVLGRIAARLDAVPEPGAQCVITGRHVASEGRKATVLSTLYGPGGDVLARARATWIAVDR
ncbi:hypothetical protein Daura_14540 [Dactylosporangium aurantiacum]|uniref:Thioesterase family protein n=1 Tax=Dactylosporangium aurantiacum TaxID=35754 RepID=A0A9Q9IKG6_9ACTN|nr:hypothetical protein [Dactylosporangium aurantiacum]MDG6109974.1 hypothetical protein [Dactylosporangium aurantiacum]UWZ57276.1 hypothetical protein Daura_14540 [Dactylosporangium aurantiacum]